MDLPRGVVTFLFSDIEGSTALWEQDPDGMGAALAAHDRLTRGVVDDPAVVSSSTPAKDSPPCSSRPRLP